MRRMWSVLLATVLAVTAAGVIGAPSAHAIGGSITGVVRDSAGAPIAGATLVAQRQANLFYYPSYSAVADSAGNYAITGLPPGTWKVGGVATGFAVRWGNAATFAAGAAIDITADESHSFDVTLPRKTASMSGTVTLPDGSPVVDATVTLSYHGDSVPYSIPGFDLSGYFGMTTTDAAGRYLISDIAPGIYTVNFTPYPNTAPPPPTPYLSEQYLNSHDPATATPIELVEATETTGIDAQLDLGATISGRVTDGAGNPAVGAFIFAPANVEAGGTVTDADGRYTLIGLPPGDLPYVMASPADPQGLPGWYGGATIDTATHLQLALGQVVDGIDIQLPAVGQVNVAVFRPDGSLAPSTFVPCIDPGVPQVVPFGMPGWGPLVKCTSGGQVYVAGSGTLRLAVGTYNALSAEGIGAFGVTSLNPSLTTSFTLTADTPLDCVFFLGGTASCSPTDPATLDGDGVAAVVEDTAPNNGDGNGDGIRDATQGNVASLPAATGGGYVTLVVADGLHLDYATVSPQMQVTQPSETGSIGVAVSGLPIGGSTDITVLRTVGGTATELWSLSHQTFTYKPMPADFAGLSIIAHVTDGGEFDAAGGPGPYVAPPDGSVSVFMIPVTPDHTPPTITCPSPDPVYAFQQYPAYLTPTVTDSGSGVVIPPTFPPPPPGTPSQPPFTQSISAFIAGPGSVTITASDKVGNTASTTCNYTVVDDGDGVPPSVENGDGNGDGIADAIQPNVAVASGFGLDPVVIATPSGTQLNSVSLQPRQFYGSPPGQTLQSDVVSSTITGITPGQSIDVDLFPTSPGGNRFWQYSGSGWVAVPSVVAGSHIRATVTDGGLGDGDGSANASISLFGAVTNSETIPPTITCGVAPTFRQYQSLASVTATVSDAESGVATPFLSLPADTSILGAHSVTFVASDLAGNQATQSCDYIVVDDGDGVPADVENAAPNNGDGNFDGILDSQQSHVASLPQPIGGGYTTIVSFFGDPLTDVSATDFSGMPPLPAGMQLNSGLYRFTVQSSTAWIYFIQSAGPAYSVFASPIGGTWQVVSSYINDGGFGDADGEINGQVSYVVAPASTDSTPPTITCPTAESFVLHQPGAGLTASVADDGSGVASGTLTVSVSTATLGTNAAVITVSDLAGNSTTVSCPYTVGVRLDRVISPNPAYTTVVKANRSIPIRWHVVDFYGAPVASANHFLGINLTAASCGRGRTTELDSVRNRGLRYLGGGRWEFDWTPPTSRGCYSLQLSLTGATQTFRIRVT